MRCDRVPLSSHEHISSFSTDSPVATSHFVGTNCEWTAGASPVRMIKNLMTHESHAHLVYAHQHCISAENGRWQMLSSLDLFCFFLGDFFYLWPGKGQWSNLPQQRYLRTSFPMIFVAFTSIPFSLLCQQTSMCNHCAIHANSNALFIFSAWHSPETKLNGTFSIRTLPTTRTDWTFSEGYGLYGGATEILVFLHSKESFFQTTFALWTLNDPKSSALVRNLPPPFSFCTLPHPE